MPGAYPLSQAEITPPVADGKSDPNPNQSGSIMLGWLGGRLFRYSDERGPALPPSSITTYGVVASYDGSLDVYDYPILAASRTVDGDGGTSPDYGPLFEVDTASAVPSDKWWPSSDPWQGLIMHFVEGTAAGYWAPIEGRLSGDSYSFKLMRAPAVAPEAGDKFRIGQLCWVVLPPLAAPIMAPETGNFMSAVNLVNGKLAIKLLRGEIRGQIEAYLSGAAWELNDPGYPFRPTTLVPLGPITKTDLQQFSVWSFQGPAPDGVTGTIGREIGLAFADIITHNDYKIDGILYVAEGVG